MFIISNNNSSFRAEEVISSGKFGHVWIGYDTNNSQKVIIKETSQNHTILMDKLTKINHPVLQIGELAYSGENVYLVRKYLSGSDIKTIISKRRVWKKFDISFWVNGFISLLNGLETLHKAGIVHRDIKPSNIIIEHDNKKVSEWNSLNFKIIDFEQSLIISSAETEERSPFSLGYAPPEQLLNRNRLTGAWSDIFSLGITLFEAISGNKAFSYHDPEMMMHIQLNLPITNNRKVDTELFEIIKKATQKQPFRLPPNRLTLDEIDMVIQSGIDKRYKSAHDLASDLKNWMTNNQSKGKRVWVKRL